MGKNHFHIPQVHFVRVLDFSRNVKVLNLPGKFPQNQSHLAKFDFGTGKLKVYFSENWQFVLNKSEKSIFKWQDSPLIYGVIVE